MAKKAKKEAVVIDDSKIDVKIGKKKKQKISKKSSFPIAKTVVVVILILILGYIFTSTKEVETIKQQNYSVTNETTTLEPYMIVEEYEEKEPLGPPRCGMTQMNFSTAGPWVEFTAESIICAFNLTNLETKEGTWEYRAYFTGVTGNKYAKQTVGPGEMSTFRFYFGKAAGLALPCEVSVESLPSIERCYFPEETFYKVVIKTRNVTKYRNMTIRSEIPMANETKTIRTVNRFFGYGMPSFGW